MSKLVRVDCLTDEYLQANFADNNVDESKDYRVNGSRAAYLDLIPRFEDLRMIQTIVQRERADQEVHMPMP